MVSLTKHVVREIVRLHTQSNTYSFGMDNFQRASRPLNMIMKMTA